MKTEHLVSAVLGSADNIARVLTPTERDDFYFQLMEQIKIRYELVPTGRDPDTKPSGVPLPRNPYDFYG